MKGEVFNIRTYRKNRQSQIADRAYNRVTKAVQTSKTTATYARLLTGEWGIRIEGDAITGTKIKVKRRNGIIDEQIVGKIREKQGEAYYCEIDKPPRVALSEELMSPDDDTVPF